MQISLQPDVEQELKAQLATGIDLNEFIRQALRNNLNSVRERTKICSSFIAHLKIPFNGSFSDTYYTLDTISLSPK